MKSIIGFESIIEIFNKRCSNGTLSHAHLITGDDGLGKSILANNLARIIIGAYESRDYVDIINYRIEKASFGIDDVRNIIDEINKKPFESDKKIIIIHEGNKLTVQAQNALLKTIEEPPKGVYILILCESLELILDTIKSRCEIYKLTPLSKDDLNKYINQRYKDKAVEEIKSAIAFSEGIPGKIDMYFESKNLKEIRDKIVDLLNAYNKNEIEEILAIEELIIKNKYDKEEVLKTISLFVRDIMIHKEIDNDDIIINRDKIKEIKQFTIDMSFRKLNNIIKKVEEARSNIKNNVNWGMTLRVMLMGFMEV